MSYKFDTKLLQETVEDKDFLVTFANTPEELDEVFHLRFKIFNLELGEGLEQSYETEKDTDIFDPHCFHLIIKHKQTNSIIATYRLLIAENCKELGFYTNQEYYLQEQLPQTILDSVVEVGRACILKDYRKTSALSLLWRGLSVFMKFYKKRYFIGCCSITATDYQVANIAVQYLKKNNYYDKKYFIKARDSYKCKYKDEPVDLTNYKLPTLFFSYLKFGGFVCSEPALDKEFKTIDFMILFDLDKIPDKFYKYFFKTNKRYY